MDLIFYCYFWEFVSETYLMILKHTLKKMVDDSHLPHIEQIQSAHHVINLQREEIDKQNTIIQTLQEQVGQSRGKG
jgi:hypothetical protein